MKSLNLKGRRKEFVEFYRFADSYKEKHGGTFDFRPTKTVVADGCRCRGFYDGTTKLIVSATKHKLFEQTFVHEFCHFTQDIEKLPIYTNAREDFWEDLDKKKWRLLSWGSIVDYIALERDCELRAIKISKKFNLFDNERYAQIANSYFYFYHYVYLTGEWVSTAKLYESPISKQMPTKILPLKTFKTINMEIMKEYERVLRVK